MYEDKIKEIEKAELKCGVVSLLYNPVLESILEEECNNYELKKTLAPKLEKILKENKENLEDKLRLAGTIEYFTEETKDFVENTDLDLTAIKDAMKRYNQGKPITINGLKFCNADKSPTDEINYKMFPTLNFVGNALFYAGFVPYAIGLPTFLITGDPTLVKAGAVAITAGFGLKFINKSVKAFLKKQPLKTIYNSALSLGAFSVTDSVINPTTPILTQIPGILAYAPSLCAAVFNIHIMYKFFKFFLSREKIKDPLPSLDEVTKDFENQVKRYTELKKQYKKIPIKKVELTEKDFVKEMKSVNKYLKYHLKKTKLKDIDVDVDNLIGIILGAAARADPFTNSAEFSTFRYADKKAELSNLWCADKKNKIDLTVGLFAKIYSHEITHLDGVMNEGKANYLAGKVLEELAIYRPNQGYDLELEKGKFSAVGHVYTLLKLNELRREGVIPELPKKSIKKNVIKYACDLLMDELKSVVKRVKHNKKPIRKHIQDLKKERAVKVKNFVKSFRKHFINDLKKKGVKDKEDLEAILKWLYPGLVRKGLFKMQSILGGSNPKGGYTVDHYKLMKRDTTFTL